MNVSRHGLGGNADVGEGEIVGNNAAPAVGAKLDLRVRHVRSVALREF
jgi:hypothetical protein